MFIEAEKKYVEVSPGRIEKRERMISKNGLCYRKSADDERDAIDMKAKTVEGAVVDLREFRGEASFKLSEISESQMMQLCLGKNAGHVLINEEKQLIFVRMKE